MPATASTKRSAPLTDGTNANNKKSKTTAAAAKDKKKTPYDRYIGAKNEWLNERKEILGMLPITGLPEKNKSKYTEKQMNSLRCIMITKNRSQQLDKMNELILGDQANESMLSFNTSFSYDVLNSVDVIKKQLARKKPDKQFDILMAYTFVLHQHDTWMHDNEGGMDVLVNGLAASWKKLLKNNSDEALGCDVEYTKPGVLSLLQQFKKEIEGHSGLGKFNYK